jgi:hypothetical protein
MKAVSPTVGRSDAAIIVPGRHRIQARPLRQCEFPHHRLSFPFDGRGNVLHFRGEANIIVSPARYAGYD